MKQDHFRIAERLAQAEQQRATVLQQKESEDTAITPYDIRARHFGRQLLWGLKHEDVMAFLDEVADAMERAQILNIEMETQVRSLQEEVQALRSKDVSLPPPELRGQAEQQERSKGETRENTANAVSRLEALRTAALQEVEALIHDAETRVQALSDAAYERADGIVREAEMLKSRGQQEAEELVTAAKATAESIVAAAQDQEAAAREEIERLGDRRRRLFDDLQATLDLCHEWLATVDPRRPAPSSGEQGVLSESVS